MTLPALLKLQRERDTASPERRAEIDREIEAIAKVTPPIRAKVVRRRPWWMRRKK